MGKLAPAASEEHANEAFFANSLLATLPRSEYLGLLASLKPLTLERGQILQEAGEPVSSVYFPIDCAVSLLATQEDEQAVEVALVGYEGMIGISVVLGSQVSSVRAVVQASGTALRMSAARFRATFQRSPPLQRGLYRYADHNLALAHRAAACNCFHAIRARLARRLLMTSDRLLSEEFSLTQAFLAQMLGVRRTTINEAAGSLQEERLIRYSRGGIRILDRAGLEAAACRCYVKLARPA